nr:atherin-like [Microcebus murinus]
MHGARTTTVHPLPRADITNRSQHFSLTETQPQSVSWCSLRQLDHQLQVQPEMNLICHPRSAGVGGTNPSDKSTLTPGSHGHEVLLDLEPAPNSATRPVVANSLQPMGTSLFPASGTPPAGCGPRFCQMAHERSAPHRTPESWNAPFKSELSHKVKLQNRLKRNRCVRPGSGSPKPQPHKAAPPPPRRTSQELLAPRGAVGDLGPCPTPALHGWGNKGQRGDENAQNSHSRERAAGTRAQEPPGLGPVTQPGLERLSSVPPVMHLHPRSRSAASPSSASTLRPALRMSPPWDARRSPNAPSSKHPALPPPAFIPAPAAPPAVPSLGAWSRGHRDPPSSGN